MVKNLSPDPPFISHYAIIQGEMGLFLTFSVFELQRGYLYQNGVEFRQKVIGAGLNLFWGHLHYFSGGIWTFPLLFSQWNQVLQILVARQEREYIILKQGKLCFSDQLE